MLSVVVVAAIAVAMVLVLEWGGMHVDCGRTAYDSLPDWGRELLEREVPLAAFAHPPLVGDNAPVDHRDLMAKLCAINDMVYYEAFRPFGLLPNGKWIPHGVPDANLDNVANTGLPASPEKTTYVAELLLNRGIAAVHDQDWHAAACHAGALAHYLQEPFTPGHAMPNDLFHEMFPDPDPGHHVRMHMFFDSAKGPLELAKPVLLGRTVPEAAFRIRIRLDRAVHQAKASAVRLVQAVYQGRHETDGNAMLLELAQGAVAMTATAWHTLLSIGTNRSLAPGESPGAKCIGLDEMVPMACHPGIGYAQVVPDHTVHNERLEDLAMRVQDEDGTLRDERFAHGLGMTCYMSGKYYVNGDVFPRFRCRVGLSSRFLRDQQPDTEATFSVEGDPGENGVYSPDLDYGPNARLLGSCTLRPGQPAQTVDVDITGVRTLILKALSPILEDPATGMKSARYPHVVVADPLLTKA